ncbi:BT4734/BF3469 family protein [Flavobacterium sp. GSP11]|uniref:BT4734/BF3469 family protein n=1 Tax=Flavobacterium sp. GSP11 TaxID=3401730 RepID=UPI003AAB3C5B
MLNYRLSIFNNAFNTIGSETSLQQELNDIRLGQYKSEINNCRNALIKENNKELYKKNKSKLKAVTFCGLFKKGRKLSNLSHYNSLIVIDIDEIVDVKEVKAKLVKDSYVMALWDSPSSQGLKGLIKVASTIENHKDFFFSLSIYFLQEYSIELDKSGSDITRLCYVSWDENIYINYESEIFKDLIVIPKKVSSGQEKEKELQQPPIISLNKSAFATEGLNKMVDRKQLKKIINYLTNKNLSITDNFSDWVKIAVIIANSFSYDVGENYFLSLCRLDGDAHNEMRSKELLKYCYNKRNLNHSNQISFASLIYIASQKGFLKKQNQLH